MYIPIYTCIYIYIYITTGRGPELEGPEGGVDVEGQVEGGEQRLTDAQTCMYIYI